VANSTLLANLAPIFVTLAGWLFWRQAVTRLFLAGMAVAIVGMFVLVGPNFGVGGTRLLGDALGALTGAFYAGYMLAMKFALRACIILAEAIGRMQVVGGAVVLAGIWLARRGSPS